MCAKYIFPPFRKRHVKNHVKGFVNHEGREEHQTPVGGGEGVFISGARVKSKGWWKLLWLNHSSICFFSPHRNKKQTHSEMAFR